MSSLKNMNCLMDGACVDEAIEFGAKEFAASELYFGHGTDNAWDEAAVLVLWVLDAPWYELESLLEVRLTDDQRHQIDIAFRRRQHERIPAAYITGTAYFAGLEFIVNEDVLVPRSPIAELILNQFAPWLSEPPSTILDMCCGSGCIGVAAATAFTGSQVDLVDISANALRVAARNIEKHQLEKRVGCIESDGFDALNQTYDLILCNPPYVDAQDIATMPDEYHAEPSIGLASGFDGLDFTRVFLTKVGEYLNPGGRIFAEVGNSWEALENAYPKVPFTWLQFEHGGHGVFTLSAEEVARAAL